MPFVPAPNIVQVEWRCTRNAQKIENRVMVNLLTEPTSMLLTPIATNSWNWWQDNYAEHLSTGVELREVVVTSLHELNAPQLTYAPSAGVTGDLEGAALPNEVSFCVSLRTGSRGRSARGRWYVLSIMQAQMEDDNNLTSAAAADFVQDLNDLRGIYSTLGYQMTIVSYRSNNMPRPGGPVYFPVSSATSVDSTVDSMKRRKPGVGA